MHQQSSRGPDIPSDCVEHWHEQQLDHFHFDSQTYKQRYFVCDRHWRRPDGPIFFYCGNEGRVEGYINGKGWLKEQIQAGRRDCLKVQAAWHVGLVAFAVVLQR